MTSVLFAQEASGSALPSLLFLALMVVVFYFLIIRPQRKRSQAQKEMAESLAVGDEVRTIGGIHGTVLSMNEDSVVLRVEDGQIRLSKRAIGTRVGDGV
ncbi:MAG TPA: preprotein translocase subunit YajC [Acidimicrobiia bacterium]|nr:preprotein translocase subunit YajC [Acidimicrobiia bacterium]